MNYQSFVDSVEMPCCVMSVEKKEDGSCGEIRIVWANQHYREAMGPRYYDNMPYYELVPQDNKFEDFCFRSAILKQRMHAYVEVRAMKCWIDQNLIPLASDRDDFGYCQFIFETTYEAEAGRMAAVSADTAEQIIRASIKLIGSDDINESVGSVLEDIREVSGAQGVRIMLVDHEKKEAELFGESLQEGAWPDKEPGTEDAITYDLIKTWESVLGESNGVIIKDENDMSALEKINSGWVESMRKHGVTSLVLMPLWNKKAIMGYLYVCNYNTDELVHIKELIELMSFFLGTVISNHMLMDQLEQISEIDVLTGVQNRRAMSRLTRELEKEGGRRTFGVVNIDLNGLKMINDRYGHEAGDELLKKTAAILRKVFRKDDMFRTGGDEFIVIAPDIDRDLFEEKVKRLREYTDSDPDVNLAIGDHWSDGTADINTAIRLSDNKMYEDKQAFYERNPEFCRL